MMRKRRLLDFCFCLAIVFLAGRLAAQQFRTPISFGPGDDPAILADSGLVYIACAGVNSHGDVGIDFAFSEDNGKTFSPGLRIDDDVTGARKDMESKTGRNMIVDGNHIYIWWYDQRNGVDLDIYFSHSHDGGQTFAPNQRLDDTGAPGDRMTSMARMAASGWSVFFALRVNDVAATTNEGVYILASNDGGQTFIAPNLHCFCMVWQRHSR